MRTKTYHFSLGDSSSGPVGFCADVIAGSKAAAVATLQSYVLDINLEHSVVSNEDDIGYLEIYFNERAITVKDIDEWRWNESD